MKDKNLKVRLAMICIFLIVMGLFAYKYNEPILMKVNKLNSYFQEISLEKELIQKVEMNYDKPLAVFVKLGNLNGKAYDIVIKHNNKIVGETTLPTEKSDGEYNLSVPINGEDVKKGDELTLVISSKEASELNMLVTQTYSENFKIDNSEVNLGLVMDVQYGGFTVTYYVIVISMMVIVALLLLFVNMKSIHNSMFVIILILGTYSAVLNPALDIPDEHDHISRADLASRGYLMMGEDYQDYRISNSVGAIIDNCWTTFDNTPLIDLEADWDTDSKYFSYANANLFFGYIPQAVGIIISKVLHVNTFWVLIIGRLMNLLLYASIIRYALKKAPIYKIPLAIISILPISLFIAASYNADTTTYALGIMAISYFLYMYKKKDISIKNIAIYFVICTLLGLVKLPYCLFIGLLIFIPKDHYESSKTYYKGIIFIVITAIIAVGWAGISVMRTEYSPYQAYYDSNGVDSGKQVIYILNNPFTFLKDFVFAMGKNISSYVEQLNVYGWFTYGMPEVIRIIFNIFLLAVIVLYPSKEKLCKKTTVGAFLVAIGVFVCTCLTLYISWTTVGLDNVLGVQGRYFIPAIGLLTLVFPWRIKVKEEKMELVNYVFLCSGILFSVIYLLTVTNRYY